MDAHHCAVIMARTYTLKRRAENQAETRRRIVEATVELHAELGPAQTTVSAIADRAGVQRHTVYAHFPTDHELYLACSGLALERDPLPDEREWRLIADPQVRLRRGLADLYAWFARNAELASSVLRDAEIHPPTREIAHMRIGTRMEAFREVLAEGFDPTPELQAALGLALSFYTWRSLVRDAGLSTDAAAAVMTRAVHNAAR
jgi:AcrR family transcriptional regulator